MTHLLKTRNLFSLLSLVNLSSSLTVFQGICFTKKDKVHGNSILVLMRIGNVSIYRIQKKKGEKTITTQTFIM